MKRTPNSFINRCPFPDGGNIGMADERGGELADAEGVPYACCAIIECLTWQMENGKWNLARCL